MYTIFNVPVKNNYNFNFYNSVPCMHDTYANCCLLLRPITGDISLEEGGPAGRPRGTAPPRRAGGWADENSRNGQNLKLLIFLYHLHTFQHLAALASQL